MGTTVSKNRRSNAAKSALAVGLALALALGGTLAWTSFSQRANNQFKASVNPGGRLHDDFIWTGDKKNKDVYVENFGDPNGSPMIFARVMLKEYFEKGVGAGPDSALSSTYPVSTEDKPVSKTDDTNWAVHYYKGDSAEHDAALHGSPNFDFDYGGQTTYLPTFNKDNQSLDPDVNGYLMNADGTESNYATYTEYEVGKAVEGTASLGGGKTQTETHIARGTLDGTVISMSEWAGTYNSEPGPYWVYDTDGWAYWAQPILPGTATGLLLNNVNLNGGIQEDWYYQVNAIGEFIDTSEEVSSTADDGKYYFGTKDSAKTGPDKSDRVTTREANALLVKVQALAVEIRGAKSASTANGNVANCTVTIQGTDYVKLAQDGSRVMLLAKNLVSTPEYNPTATEDADKLKGPFSATSATWDGSAAMTWCNGAYYDSLPAYIKNRIVDTTYKTREKTGSDTIVPTTSKVFLLSEADVFGTDGGYEAPADLYTFNGRLIPEAASALLKAFYKDGSQAPWWLRSPYYRSTHVAALSVNGVFGAYVYSDEGVALRPAFWIDLAF